MEQAAGRDAGEDESIKREHSTLISVAGGSICLTGNVSNRRERGTLLLHTCGGKGAIQSKGLRVPWRIARHRILGKPLIVLARVLIIDRMRFKCTGSLITDAPWYLAHVGANS